MNKTHKKRRYGGELSRKLLFRYFLWMWAVVGAVAGLAILSVIFLSTFSFWREIPPLRHFVYGCRDNILGLVLFCIVAGWVICALVLIGRTLRWLDQLVEAAELLVGPEDEDVVLDDELSAVEDHLNEAKQRALRDASAAKEAEQRKNDLVVYLAHDLKTPLTSVIGYLTLLRDEPDLSPQLRARYTGIALDKAERLEELINEFFDITRFNLTHLELEKQPVDLTRMLQQVSSEFEPQFAEKGLTCRLDLPPTLEYDCDPDKLARVFDNLLRNAFHYSFPDSEVSVTARRDKGGIHLTFVNCGRTIPPEKLSRIFDQFFRLDSSRATRTGGAGLGLAIAKQIVELHGGTICAQSADNRAIFTVDLPAPDCDEAQDRCFT